MASTLPKTLPASWFTSLPLHRLERRAVFLKAWYLVGTVVKFTAGEPVDYEFSGISLTIQRTGENEGSIKSVDSHGNELRTHITSTGLVFTTITDDAPPFEEFFPGVEKLLASVDFTKRPYRRSIKYEGHFNWKTMVDGYQE
jgi:phenylpropionate dioxygenase-like ring-hydroxylating dioxygenase large terminal subunit